MITPAGAILGFLGAWLFLCDSRNEFAPFLIAAGLAGLCVGSYWGI